MLHFICFTVFILFESILFAGDNKSKNQSDPVFLLCVRDGEKNTLMQLDKECKIGPAQKGIALNLPVVLVSKHAVGKKMFPNFQRFLKLVCDLNEERLAIMHEISEIEYIDEYRINVKLKSRKTIFIIEPKRDEFYRINYFTGYLDMLKYYPDLYVSDNGRGIIRLK